MKKNKLFIELAKFYPKKLAKHYDHVGLMCGKLKDDINKILVCLDFDEEVLPIAIKERPDLILTHHPFIFGTRAQIIKRDEKKKELIELIEKENIPVYSMHTNFDAGKDGMNDALANLLKLKDVKPLAFEPLGRGGTLEEEMEIIDFARYVKKNLNCQFAWLIAKGKKTIKSVAIIGGGGANDYKAAMNENYDIFISGDSSHHTRRDIVRDKYNFLEVPHEVERIFVKAMSNKLHEIDSSLQIVEVDHEKEPELI